MKRNLILTVIGLLALNVTALWAAKPSQSEIQQALAEVKSKIESQDYTINVKNATPLKGGSIAVENSLLVINGNKASSSLPYWGSGYNSFNNDEGMRFQGTISDYKITDNKKDRLMVAFKVKAETGRIYQFKLEVYYNGSTFISTTCTNLDPMRYIGQLRPSGID